MRVILIAFLIVSSCTTIGSKELLNSAPKVSTKSSDRAPQFSEYRDHKDLSAEQLASMSLDSKALERWRKHVLALRLTESEASQSCPYWEELSKDETYPLRNLAELRFQLICAKPPATITAFSPDETLIFEEILAVRDLALSVQTEGLEDDVNAIINQARLVTHFQEREALYKKALSQAKASKDPALIKLAQEALYKNSPRLDPKPTKDMWRAAAQDHRVWRNFSAAIRLYKKILRDKDFTDEDKYNALKSIRYTYKTAQNKKAYISSTYKLARWTEKNWKRRPNDFVRKKRFHDSQLLLTRTLWTEDRTTAALKSLAQLEKKLGAKFSMEEVYFIRSRIYEEQKKFKSAHAELKKALAEKQSQRDLRDKILWASAWLNYKQDNWNESVTLLQELSTEGRDESDKNRAKYWLGRSLQKLNKEDESKVAFKELSEADPLGIYGLWALRELGEKLTPIQTQVEADERVSSLSLPSETRALAVLTDWLVAVGESNFAEKSLNRLSQNLRQLKSDDEDIWLRILSQYAQAGSYLPLFSAMYQLEPEVRESILKNHPEFLFPQPYKGYVETAAKNSGVDPALIYSIMRQESAFNPKARSPVDAYGLMQLLPSVAKVRAQHLKLPFKKATDLFEPELNIHLGADELRSLFDKYKDQYILAVSAYNANERALRGWLKVRYREDPLEFIEEIPYEETRTYIKLVLRNYVFYQRFTAMDSFAFPESCLKLSQNL